MKDIPFFIGLQSSQSFIDDDGPYVVEYSRSQRIDRIDSLATSLTMNLRQFKEGNSGDWEPLAACPDYDTAYEIAIRLREEFPERYASPLGFTNRPEWTERPASDRQKAYLRKLGYHGPDPKNMAQASVLIQRRLADRGVSR